MKTYYARFDHEDRQVECLSGPPEYEAEHRSVYYDTIRAESIEDARQKANERFGKELAEARLFNAAPELLKKLEFAVSRIRMANADGDPILSAWLLESQAVIDKATKGTP